MSKPAIKIVASYADGKSLDGFQKLLAKRQHYLNETAFQSIHAMAMDTLKSLRGITKVAKASGIKVAVSPRSDLQFSYYREGAGGGRRMCLRSSSGTRIERNSQGAEVYDNLRGVKLSAVQVYEFKDVNAGNKTYLISSTSQGRAKKAAQRIAARRLLRYSGLARRAISALMIKTNTKAPADGVSPRVAAKANEVTATRNIVARDTNGGGGKYALVLEDNLRYALRALKGGPSQVNLALQRAANKSAGLINHRCKDLLLPGEVKTPFPDIVKKSA